MIADSITRAKRSTASCNQMLSSVATQIDHELEVLTAAEGALEVDYYGLVSAVRALRLRLDYELEVLTAAEEQVKSFSFIMGW